MIQSEITNEALQKMFIKPEVAARIVNAMIPGNRPSTWCRRSNATYYKEVYAKQLLLTLDGMMVDKQDRLWLYDEWKKYTPNTLYQRINLSVRYILDNLDPDKKYKNFREQIDIFRDRKILAIRMTMRQEFRDDITGVFTPQIAHPSAEMPKWRLKIEEWVETAEVGGRPFVLEKLALSPEEVKQLKTEFMGTDILAAINAISIKLVKYQRA